MNFIDYEQDNIITSIAYSEGTLWGIWASHPIVEIPDIPDINCVSPYCFSDSDGGRQDIQEARRLLHEHVKQRKDEHILSPFTGDFVEKVSFSTAIESLGEYCFYNCKKLKNIKVLPGLINIHSDVFMNCKSLKDIVLEADVSEPTGLYNILSRIKTGVEVCFAPEKEGDPFRIYYPEYSMNYEAVYAAHIFQMRVTGGGYAMRQSFKGGILDTAGYDTSAEKYILGEDDEAKILISALRLLYPEGLTDKSRLMYEDILKRNGKNAAVLFVKREDAASLKKLIKNGMVGADSLKAAVDFARDTGKNRFIMELCR